MSKIKTIQELGRHKKRRKKMKIIKGTEDLRSLATILSVEKNILEALADNFVKSNGLVQREKIRHDMVIASNKVVDAEDIFWQKAGEILALEGENIEDNNWQYTKITNQLIQKEETKCN
jgi:hypothetical protein